MTTASTNSGNTQVANVVFFDGMPLDPTELNKLQDNINIVNNASISNTNTLTGISKSKTGGGVILFKNGVKAKAVVTKNIDLPVGLNKSATFISLTPNMVGNSKASITVTVDKSGSTWVANLYSDTAITGDIVVDYVYVEVL